MSHEQGSARGDEALRGGAKEWRVGEEGAVVKGRVEIIIKVWEVVEEEAFL